MQTWSENRDSVSGYNVDNTRKLQKYKVRPQLIECCKYVEDEGYWNLELIGDHQDHLEIGGDQQQYKGVKILQEFLLVYSRALRQRLEVV